jgi:hypothetical protein
VLAGHRVNRRSFGKYEVRKFQRKWAVFTFSLAKMFAKKTLRKWEKKKTFAYGLAKKIVTSLGTLKKKIKFGSFIFYDIQTEFDPWKVLHFSIFTMEET